MIASYNGKFVFIKTRKTAGTSAEIVLGSWCGPGDIVTPITAEDELLRRDFGGQAQNFGKKQRLEQQYQAAILTGDLNAIKAVKRRLNGTLMFENHMPAHRVRDLLPDLWRDAFTFTVERHPYEKVVSYAYWEASQRGMTSDDNLTDLIEEIIATGVSNNYPLYTDKGRVIVDRVVDYADVWCELAALANTIDKPMPDTIPQAKSRFRADRRPARDTLTFGQKDRIARSAEFEFDLLGYER